jgi:hypothetical protein
VGILSIQEPHGLQMYTASVLWLHPIPAQLNELDLIIPPPTHHRLFTTSEPQVEHPLLATFLCAV